MLFRRYFPSNRSFLTALAVVILPLTGGHRVQAEPLAEMAAFSELKNVDLDALAGGKVITARGAPMNFPRGLAVQACYIVPLPLSKTADFHKQWNAGRHRELKVYLHHELPSRATAADFQILSSAPDNSAVRSFIEATQKLNPQRPELQMSAAEAAQFSKTPSDGTARKGSMPPQVAGFWGNLLSQRTHAFLAGGASRQPAYDAGGETIRASDEIARLLKEQPKIRSQFAPLLAETALASSSGKLTPSLYFELFDVEGRGALTLGASYSRPAKESWQSIDAQYYGSDGYYVLLTFYQFWPITTRSGPATLVWRGDLLSSASMADLHGIERMGSMGAMMKEIQKSIGFLISDAAGNR